MAESNLENLKTQIIDLVKTIKPGTDKNWRSDIKHVEGIYYDIDAFTEFPVVMVLFGDEALNSMDNARFVWNGKSKLILLVYTDRAGMEDVIHDLKRLLAEYSMSRVNAPTNRWIFQTEKEKPGITIMRSYFAGVDNCIVSLDVDVELRNQTTEF